MINNIIESWSAEEIRKAYKAGGEDNGVKKVRSLNNLSRKLRGGDWVLSRNVLVTLAVA
jgi:hypothetical protein